MREFLTGSNKIDKIYGPVYEGASFKWILGRQVIEFDRKAPRMKLGKLEFPGTKGLY